MCTPRVYFSDGVCPLQGHGGVGKQEVWGVGENRHAEGLSHQGRGEHDLALLAMCARLCARLAFADPVALIYGNLCFDVDVCDVEGMVLQTLVLERVAYD